MLKLRSLAICLAVAGVSMTALGQEPATIEPVTTHIPASAMGFIVINDLKGATGRLEKFIDDIGMGDMLKAQMPQGMLATLTQALQLGEGFNPSGGVAVALLDPEPFKVNLLRMLPIPGAPPPAADEAKPGLPLVVFVPGKSAEAVFGQQRVQKGEKYATVMSPAGPLFATECGGYIALSPMPEVLEALAKAEAKAVASMAKRHAKVITEADIVVHINFKVAGPTIDKALKLFESYMEAMAEEAPVGTGMWMSPFGQVKDIMPMYRSIFAQLDGLTLSARFIETGLLVEEVVTYKPDSDLGKAMAAVKAPESKLLDRLPNLNYVLAFGSTAGSAEMPDEMMSFQFASVKSMFSQMGMSLTDELMERIEKLAKGLNEEITEIQFVGGGAPEGSGLFGVACVLKCNNAANARKLLADGVGVSNELIGQTIGQMNEELAGLKLAYTEGAETVGGTPVDTIDLTHPEMAEMAEEDLAEMAKALGEGRMRCFVAMADPKTLVVTFGGGKAFLAKALEAAQKGGTLPADPSVKGAMKYMPENPVTLAVINPSNLLKLVNEGIQKMDPENPGLPIMLQSKDAIAIGMGVDGPAAHAVFYVPSTVVKDIVGAVMSFQMMMAPMGPGPMPPPPPPGEDF